MKKVDYREQDFSVSVCDAEDKVILEIEGFDNDIDRQEFAELLSNTLSFDKLYLMKLLNLKDSTIH
jgi:hypothetical protein